MPTLLYIHGFLSSPKSVKAQATQAWLRYHRPQWQYQCPFLSSFPAEAKATLDGLVSQLEGEEVFLVGSSLGGFWATYLTERYGFRSVLVNPAVHPQLRFTELVGVPLSNYHTGEPCILGQQHIEQLAACDPPTINNLDSYWLMVQTGDETLDYRDAVARYQGCRQTVETGGDHGFVGYDSWLAEVVDFFETPAHILHPAFESS